MFSFFALIALLVLPKLDAPLPSETEARPSNTGVKAGLLVTGAVMLIVQFYQDFSEAVEQRRAATCVPKGNPLAYTKAQGYVRSQLDLPATGEFPA